jgi:hypothetical protein
MATAEHCGTRRAELPFKTAVARPDKCISPGVGVDYYLWALQISGIGYAGMHFFTTDGGGNFMMYVNLIWAWGHPEVYILVLPAFGICSEVIATFSSKRLFGYRSMVLATLAICVLSFMVWLHHFFTMGAGADVNAVFGIMSMIISSTGCSRCTAAAYASRCRELQLIPSRRLEPAAELLGRSLTLHKAPTVLPFQRYPIGPIERSQVCVRETSNC